MSRTAVLPLPLISAPRQDEQRQTSDVRLGHLHPSFMGGEYLPVRQEAQPFTRPSSAFYPRFEVGVWAAIDGRFAKGVSSSVGSVTDPRAPNPRSRA
jgi:hypothetical protein